MCEIVERIYRHDHYHNNFMVVTRALRIHVVVYCVRKIFIPKNSLQTLLRSLEYVMHHKFFLQHDQSLRQGAKLKYLNKRLPYFKKILSAKNNFSSLPLPSHGIDNNLKTFTS